MEDVNTWLTETFKSMGGQFQKPPTGITSVNDQDVQSPNANYRPPVWDLERMQQAPAGQQPPLPSNPVNPPSGSPVGGQGVPSGPMGVDQFKRMLKAASGTGV